MKPTPTTSAVREYPEELAGEWRSEKIQAWHRERVAVVYVRQSTGQQVRDHKESARLQYGLVAHARALGWAAERVVVIDDDQGQSGTEAENRRGFQALVAEVSLAHVGLILGSETARLARSNKDWHQLLELCGLFGTLLADLDGIYDPTHYNDRLLLGLKGAMSEAELHILKQRMTQGRLSKARRGELALMVPIGYVLGAEGEVSFDPDEQVQHIVRLVFRKFEELGTVNAVLRYLAQHHIEFGIRVPSGLDKGKLTWHRPARMTLYGLLTNPRYTGAYVYGRRQVDPRHKRAGRPSTGRVLVTRRHWRVLLKDHFPAYISWEQYERNQARLQANQACAQAIGAVRHGAALLAGLVVCGKCGARLFVQYRGSSGRHVYRCSRQRRDHGEQDCQRITGPCLEEWVSQQVLAALAPAAVELSLEAAGHVERERAELRQVWQQRLERAAYEAERAARQYHLTEPEHRLVARQLEREWEEKLATQQQLQEAYEQFTSTQARVLSDSERTSICRLAADIPALWHAPTTTTAERKEILRQVVEWVVVDVQNDSEQVHVQIEWVGGALTTGVVRRPVQRLEQLSTYPQLLERVRTLVVEGLPAAAIAQRLTAEGYRPTQADDRFSKQSVKELRQRLGLSPQGARHQPRTGLGTDEWWLSELAQAIGMSRTTLAHWVTRGWARARQEAGGLKRWIVWADATEVERLRQHAQRSKEDEARQRWRAAVTTSPAPEVSPAPVKEETSNRKERKRCRTRK